MNCEHPINIPVLDCCGGVEVCFPFIACAMGTRIVSYTTSARIHYQSIEIEYNQFPLPIETFNCTFDPWTLTVIAGSPNYAPEARFDWTIDNHYLSVGGQFYGSPFAKVTKMTSPISEDEALAAIVGHVSEFDFDSVRAIWRPAIETSYGLIGAWVSDPGQAGSMLVGGTPNWTRTTELSSLVVQHSLRVTTVPECVQLATFSSKGAYNCPGFPFINTFLEPYSMLTAAKARLFNTGPLWIYENDGLSFSCSPEYPKGPPINCSLKYPIQDPDGFEYIDLPVRGVIGLTSIDAGLDVCLP